jgi:hypothetical protein
LCLSTSPQTEPLPPAYSRGLTDELMAARNVRRLRRLQDHLSKTNLLIAHELGYVPFAAGGSAIAGAAGFASTASIRLHVIRAYQLSARVYRRQFGQLLRT